MTRPQAHIGRYGLLRSAHAEFLKIWASRMPLVFLVAIPALCYLVVFELYHVEHVGSALALRHAVQALPLLFVGVWKLLLFQAAVLAFAAFWTTVDSQYGMIRVVGAQPLSRAECLLGKWIGVSAHIALATAVLILSLFSWAAIYSGLRGITGPEVARLFRFSLELLTVTLALGAIGLATASFRRTVGSGIVTAVITFIALAVMTTLPFDVLAPRFVFVRYLFYPVQEFPNPFPDQDSLFLRMYSPADFYLVMLVTPLVLAIPAIIYFRRRDITE